jgi:RNA polymerase sigma-70 factor (ECF subfamily)
MAAAPHSGTGTICPAEERTLSDRRVDELYEAYHERLFRFVLPRLHGDCDAAEDIVQESFTAALVSLSGFRSRSSPYTWLCSIAQHKIADHYRRQPQPGATNASDCEDHLGDESEEYGPSSVESWFEAQETRDLLRRALRGLPPDYEHALRRKYFAGLSTVELSVEMERSPKAIEGLLARARQALSRSLSDQAPAQVD